MLRLFVFVAYLTTQAGICNLDDSLSFDVVRNGQHYELYAHNHRAFDITFEVNIDTENLTAADSFPIIATVSGNMKTKITELYPVDRDSQIRYEVSSHFVVGNMYAEHDTNYVYHLPFKPGTSQKVGQSLDDDITHNIEARHAVDFEMKEGTAIYAIREGVVVAVCDVYDRGGPDRELATKGNYVYVRHLDKTIAAYVHLQKGGAAVQVGNYVEPGTIIGYSGNTGFSFGPHLHLEVFKATNGKSKRSFPMKFRTEKSIIHELKKGKKYKAARLQSVF